MLKNKLWLFGDSYVANGRPGTWINKLAKKLNCTIEHTGEDGSSLEASAWELHCCKERIGRNDKVIFMFTQPHRITFKGKTFAIPTLDAIDDDGVRTMRIDKLKPVQAMRVNSMLGDTKLFQKFYANFIDDAWLDTKKLIVEGFITHTLEELETDQIVELDFYGELDYRGISHRQGICDITSTIYHSKGYSNIDIRDQYETQQFCKVLNQRTCWNHMGRPGTKWDIVNESLDQFDFSALDD